MARVEEQTRAERARREHEEQLRRRAEAEQEELRNAQRRQAVALERISDAVFEVHVDEWSAEGVRAGRIERPNAAVSVVFGPSVDGGVGALVDACLDADALVELLVAHAPIESKELRFAALSGGLERTVHVSVVHYPEVLGER